MSTTSKQRQRGTFIGPRLRRLRRELALTQAQMAANLDISPSYIALMERNQRPVSAAILLRLASAYSVDVAELASEGADAVRDRLADVLGDPMFADIEFGPSDLEDIASGYPAVIDALLRLHTAYRQSETALADRTQTSPPGPDPAAEARRFLGARKNFFPALDQQAERLAGRRERGATLEAFFEARTGYGVRRLPREAMAGSVRRLDHHRRELVLDESLDGASARFQLALQLAYLALDDALEAALSEGSFASESGRRLARRALANYAAGALLMPYGAFLAAAEEFRYDLEALGRRYGASFEQTAHRLTTLQKPGQEGVPFFFIRVDMAGNVSKRLDGAGFPFARHGGSCPLWSVHHAFRAPRTVLAEWIELPGGERFFSICRAVQGGGGAYGAVRAERAIALGCGSDHAHRLVYTDDPKLSPERATPIGVACRLCHRTSCIARAEPPIGRPVADDTSRRPAAPFAFTDD